MPSHKYTFKTNDQETVQLLREIFKERKIVIEKAKKLCTIIGSPEPIFSIRHWRLLGFAFAGDNPKAKDAPRCQEPEYFTEPKNGYRRLRVRLKKKKGESIPKEKQAKLKYYQETIRSFEPMPCGQDEYLTCIGIEPLKYILTTPIFSFLLRDEIFLSMNVKPDDPRWQEITQSQFDAAEQAHIAEAA